jgi:hypothetical protein
MLELAIAIYLDMHRGSPWMIGQLASYTYIRPEKD